MSGFTARWEGLKEWEQSESAWFKEVVQMTIYEVEKIAFKIERDAKLLSPVDTGKLRGSIKTDVNRKTTGVSAEVGTDVEYSEIVEFGGSKQRAQPYLIPSFDRNIQGLESAINNVLRGD